MTPSNSTCSQKPAKPSPDFPLTPHPSGRWCKKILGKLHYFGPWADPDGALAKYLAEKDRLHAGLTTADNPDELTVFSLCAKFLTTKKRMMESGELSPRSLADYGATCKRLVKVFGKARPVSNLRPDDFEKLRAGIAKRYGPHRLGNEINRTRIVFNYALKSGLIDRAMIYGEGFKRPSRKTLRKHRAEQGPKMFSADEIRSMLDKAGQPLKAMILLGINCGYGNSDVATLPVAALDLDGAWINYARPKTGIDRRCPLWPETVDAIRDWLAVRPKAKDEQDAGLLFITKYGSSWGVDPAAITKEFRKLLDKLKINGHRNYYALRHTLQTIGDDARDFVAVRSIMGLVGDNDIADVYRERVSDDRLKAVTEHVRTWLFGTPAKQKKPATKKEKPALRIFSA
ncbi:MAG: tyrosine-type recombinase/integrase [Gemmataceae bacterium]|nr:tyrosine-type recombinase/integrase [Gemmataceae bacterium]